MASSQAEHRLLLLFILLPILATSAPTNEAEALLRFKSLLTNSTALNNWNKSAAVCSGDRRFWTGVACRNGAIRGLRLENMSLAGFISADTLTALPNLKTLSFMNNEFEGPLPEVKKLRALRALFLSNNRFSGEISGEAFEGMRSLRRLYLAGNRFSGEIPSSLADLPVLMELGLERNQFSGEIPAFSQRDWTYLNLSNNLLEGSIPSPLKNNDFTSFLGNKGLCGEPLPQCKSTKKPYTLIAAISAAAATLLILLLLLRRRLLRPSKSQNKIPKIFRPNSTQSPPSESYESHYKKRRRSAAASLQFVRSDRARFEFGDLLGAAAEVLGSGSFGSSYKAQVSEETTVVVKRFRHMNGVGRDEFYCHMRRLGKLSHPNLLPLVGVYCGKDDKLLISDFVPNGSLASHLHGKRAPGNRGLSWGNRVKIIKGVARGLAYLHKELPDLPLPHGHLKSSNVLLDQTLTPILSDYALSPVLDAPHARHHLAAFHSPEFTRLRRTSKSADVWSLGVLILETLTGQFPASYFRRGGGDDVGAWVEAVAREEVEAAREGGVEAVKMVRIGIRCCEWEEGRRWGMKEAVERIEEVKEIESGDGDDDEFYSSYGSDKDFQFLAGRTDDESSFLS